MEVFILIIIFALAVFLVSLSFFKKKGCDGCCGKNCKDCFKNQKK